MTIRDYIKRRFRKLALIFALAYASLQILSLCIRQWPETFSGQSWSIVLGLTAPRVLLVILAWFAIRVMTITCPRCFCPLGGATVAALIGNKKANRCPHCRVSLDEPVKATDRD
ncbi:MAG: hypothetical protein WA642_06240 [Steroidobacteraceae bacterium]